MVDQTIEIKLVLRDELSRQLQPVIQGMRELQNARIDQAAMRFDRLGGAARVVHREFSSLARLTLGGLIGGGVVAGIYNTAKALGEMARENLNLRYTAEGLGVAPEFLERMQDGLHALGMSTGEAASSVKSAINTLREAEVQGSKSSLFGALEKGAHGSGIRLWNQIKQQMAGPEGAEGAFKFLITRMRDMNPSGQRALMKHLGLSSLAFKDLQEVLPQLNKRIQLSREESLRLSVANANFGISMGNIGRILGSAVMPGVEKVTTAFSKFLQTDSGKKFSEELRTWSDSVGTAIAGWITDTGPDGLTANIESLKKSVGELKEYFKTADDVIQAMGWSWPGVMKALAGTGFALWLTSVAAQLALIARIPGVVAILTALGAAAWFLNKNMADEITDPEERRKAKESGAPQGWGAFFLQFLNDLKNGNIDLLGQGDPNKPKPQSGEGQPKSEQERRADLAHEKGERDALARELRDATYAMAKFNDYTAPGGPEGSADGRSGYGAGTMGPQLPGPGGQADGRSGAGPVPIPNDLSLGAFQTMFRDGKFADQYSTVVEAAQKHGIPPSLMASIFATETGYGRSNAVKTYNNPAGLMGGGFMNRKFQQFESLSEGIDKAGEVQKRIYERGGRAIAGMGAIYAPVGKGGRPVGNDPNNTNRLWPGLVSGIQTKLTDRGYDPGGLFGIEPPAPSFAERASGMDAAGFSSITRAQASENGGGSINGSATVDIDVSGLGGGESRSDSLFKPSPLGGAVQMQNAQHVPNNLQSFQ